MNLTRYFLTASTVAASILFTQFTFATIPLVCEESTSYTDITGNYTVTGGCPDAWCPTVVAVTAFGDSECEFVLQGAQTTLGWNQTGATLLNPASDSGLTCSSPSQYDTGSGVITFQDCDWSGVGNATCDAAITLTPTDDPENYACGSADPVTNDESSGSGDSTVAGEQNTNSENGNSDTGASSSSDSGDDSDSSSSGCQIHSKSFSIVSILFLLGAVAAIRRRRQQL